MNSFRNNLEKDFEFFVKNLPKLEPVEFCGLAKILGVSMYKTLEELNLTVDELKNKSNEELIEIENRMNVPLEEVWEKMMDKFLELPRRRRKEINKILKEVKKNGSTAKHCATS